MPSRLIKIDLRQLDGATPETNLRNVVIDFAPFTRVHVVDGQDDYVLTEAVHRVRAPGGVAELELPVTVTGHGVLVTEAGFAGAEEYVTQIVAGSGDLQYGDLPRVDRTSLDPIPDETAAWVAPLDAEEAARIAGDEDLQEQINGLGTGAVTSVNGHAGVVVLTPDDLDDVSSSHKFVTAGEKTKLGNTSGTNTGDQDLSGLASSAALASEATTRGNADAAEITARSTADATLQGSVDAEVAARGSAVTTLQGNIAAEEAARIAGDSGLTTALTGKADLSGPGGTVPASQLPSYVDDVLEFVNLAAFPAVGETGKIYVAKDTNLTYRWTGSAYGGLDPSLALGETSSTAYRGDRGKTAYDHSQITSGNPHGTTAADVGAQPVDADLTSIAAVTSAADKMLYATGANTWTLATLTAFARSFLDDPDAATVRATLGLGTAATQPSSAFDAAGAAAAAQAASQPVDTDLTTIAGLTATTDNVIQSVGGSWASRTMAQLKTALGLVKADVGLGNVDNTSNSTERAAAATLTNKRITKRVTSVTSAATVTIDLDATDVEIITAQAAALTIALTGTPTQGQPLIIRIKDDGTARPITYPAAARAIGVALPTTTVVGKTTYLGGIYNTTDAKLDIIAVAQEA